MHNFFLSLDCQSMCHKHGFPVDVCSALQIGSHPHHHAFRSDYYACSDHCDCFGTTHVMSIALPSLPLGKVGDHLPPPPPPSHPHPLPS